MSSSRKFVGQVFVFIVCLLVLIFGGWFFVQGVLKKASSDNVRVMPRQSIAKPQATASPQTDFTNVPLGIGDAALMVEVVKSESALARGLSGRSSLPQERGMFFDLSEERIPSFWMKDMNFPLDFIWINSAFIVVDTTENVSPASFPATVSPEQPARYVLEVNTGFIEKYDIGEGVRVIAPTIENRVKSEE